MDDYQFEKQNVSQEAPQKESGTATGTETMGGSSTIQDFDYQKYAEVEKKANRNDAVIALVTGIGSIVLSFLSVLLGLIAGIVGIVYGRRAKRDPEQRSMGMAGFICAIIGTALNALSIIWLFVVIGFFATL